MSLSTFPDHIYCQINQVSLVCDGCTTADVMYSRILRYPKPVRDNTRVEQTKLYRYACNNRIQARPRKMREKQKKERKKPYATQIAINDPRKKKTPREGRPRRKSPSFLTRQQGPLVQRYGIYQVPVQI